MRNENFREFAKYASLNTLGMVGLSLYILADTFFYPRDWAPTGDGAESGPSHLQPGHGAGLMLGMGGATGIPLSSAEATGKPGQ